MKNEAVFLHDLRTDITRRAQERDNAKAWDIIGLIIGIVVVLGSIYKIYYWLSGGF